MSGAIRVSPMHWLWRNGNSADLQGSPAALTSLRTK
jgi:hypothetical protein